MSKKQELPESQAESEAHEIVEQIPEEESAELKQAEIAGTEEETESKPTEISLEELQRQLEQAKQQAAQNWDIAARARAEMENLRKRAQKDIENAHKYALENFAREMLTVIDSLELGIKACTGESPEVAKLKEGSELTLKQFESVFAKFNIEAIDPIGQPFNPEHHQAMSMQPSAEHAPNTVVNVFQKGYLLNGRLIRPAMVVVSKAAEDESPPKAD